MEDSSGRKHVQLNPGDALLRWQAALFRKRVMIELSPAAIGELHAARRRNEAAGGLPTLPLDLIVAICRRIRMRDRVALTGCCGTLRSRQDVNSSSELWGWLAIRPLVLNESHAPLGAWLARHRCGLHTLTLRSWGEPRIDPAVLLGGLTGSTLGALHLNMPLIIPGVLDFLPQLRLLTSLELGTSCRLEGALPCQLSALTGLLSLDVQGNVGLCEEPSIVGWAPLQHIVSLTHLSISDCGLVRLPQQLSALGALMELFIDGNRFSDEDRLTALHHLTALTRLDARACNICRLPERLSAAPHLAALNLGRNYSLGQQGDDPPEAMAALQHLGGSLTSLSLANCGLQMLPPQLSALSNLAELQLEHNHELGRAGNVFPWPLRHLTSLTLLDLSYCDLITFPAKLAALPSLAALEFNGNELLGSDAWEPLSRLTSLTRLGLERCELVNPPPQLAALEALCSLAVGFNGTSRRGPGLFVEDLCILLQPLTRLTLLTGQGLGADLGERLAAAGVDVPCMVTVSSADWV